MASNGSFSTNQVAATSRVWYWDFSWWVTGWNGNTASIHWQAVARCTSGNSGYRYVSNFGFGGSIAGNSIGNPGGDFVKDTWVASGDITLGGGTRFSADIWAHPYSGSYTSSGSGEWTLDNNVVTPSVSVSIGSRTETTIAASMSVTNNGNAGIVDNYIDLFTDSGCTNKVGTISGTSGTFTGLNPNTTYYARANASNGTYRGYSGVPSTSTYQYPYVSAIETSNLTIGNQQKLTLYNPLSRNVNIYMKKDSTSGTTLFSKTGATTGTSYSFTPTASTLYNSIPTSTSGSAIYYCVYSNKTVSTKSGTYKVSGNNAQAPTFTDFNYKDTDSLASQLTGKNGVNNPGILIAGLSNCEFTVTTSQKATSGYGATLDKYNFSWPNKAGTSSNYSSSANVTSTISDGNTNIISVSAYDKRGQYKTVSKTITLITPTNAKGDINTVRQNGINTTTYLNGAIAYWAGDWANGSSRPNALLKVEYRINKTGNYYDITSAVTANSTAATSGKIKTLTLKSNIIQLHANGSSGGFTVGRSYTVEIFVTTGLNSTYVYENRQKIAEILVTSGVFGMSRFKSSDGKYHYGFNGLPHSKHTVDVHGNVHAESSFNNHTSRLTSGNIKPNSDKDYGGFRHDVATSSMTNGKPPFGDGHIFTMFWDNNGRYDVQMAISDTTDKIKGIAVRGKTNTDDYRAWKTLLDMIYPVGSIYLSWNSTNPSTYFGGTWVQLKGGFLYGFVEAPGTGNGTGTATNGNNGNTGSTAITVDQMPRHNHKLKMRNAGKWNWNDGSASGDMMEGGYYWEAGNTTYNWLIEDKPQGGNKGHTHTLNNHSHNIPYIAVSVWRRTA